MIPHPHWRSRLGGQPGRTGDGAQQTAGGALRRAAARPDLMAVSAGTGRCAGGRSAWLISPPAASKPLTCATSCRHGAAHPFWQATCELRGVLEHRRRRFQQRAASASCNYRAQQRPATPLRRRPVPPPSGQGTCAAIFRRASLRTAPDELIDLLAPLRRALVVTVLAAGGYQPPHRSVGTTDLEHRAWRLST